MGDKYWKLGIIGWPLGYSLSPLMHTAALAAAGLKGEYREIKVKPEELEKWLAAEAPQLDGFNVTMPHKQAVWEHVSRQGEFGQPSPQLVRAIGAVNTVAVRDGRFVGYNTDGEGFWTAMGKRRPLLVKWQVLLLGAGGAARAIVAVLEMREIARHVAIWSRTFESAQGLAEELQKVGGGNRRILSEAVRDLGSFPVEKCQMVINATPLGMSGEGDVPWAVMGRLHRRQVVYDIVYEPKETRLVLAARKAGCAVITGDGMLAGQGAAAFKVWTGKNVARDGTPILKVMKQALEKHFAEQAGAR